MDAGRAGGLERRRARPRQRDGHVPAEEVLVGAAGEPGLGPDAEAAGGGAGAGSDAAAAPEVDVGVLAGADDVAAVGGVRRGDLAAGVLESCEEEARVPFGLLWSLRVACFVNGKLRAGFAAVACVPLNFWRTVMPLKTRICESADVTRISDGFAGANCTIDGAIKQNIVRLIATKTFMTKLYLESSNLFGLRLALLGYAHVDLRLLVQLAIWHRSHVRSISVKSSVEHMTELIRCAQIYPLSCRTGSSPCANQ